jgi:hypothetical protein
MKIFIKFIISAILAIPYFLLTAIWGALVLFPLQFLLYVSGATSIGPMDAVDSYIDWHDDLIEHWRAL